jgi:hypothetical protein
MPISMAEDNVIYCNTSLICQVFSNSEGLNRQLSALLRKAGIVTTAVIESSPRYVRTRKLEIEHRS